MSPLITVTVCVCVAYLATDNDDKSLEILTASDFSLMIISNFVNGKKRE